MKKLFTISSIVLLMFTMLMLNSCSNEELFKMPEQDMAGWNTAKVKFNVEFITFDQNGKSTRAADAPWKDGDIIYLMLTDKDGKKQKAHVQYDASKGDWGYINYNCSRTDLTCSTDRAVEAYYMSGASNPNKFDALNAVYTCTNGTYVFPDNGDMIVKVTLKPITGRIRFEGTPGTKVGVAGIKYYNSFSPDNASMTVSSDTIFTTIEANGSTPYVYGLFESAENPKLTLLNNSQPFQTTFDSSTPVLKTGKSGFLTLPTLNSHNGWIIPILSITVEPDANIKAETDRFRMDETTEDGKNAGTLKASIYPTNATYKTLKWSSSNTAVATVDNAGHITAAGHGTTIITVSSEKDDQVKSTYTLKVADETKVFVVNGVAFGMSLVEAGTLTLGDNSVASFPPHDVTLTNDYYMGRTEVTQALWQKIMGGTPIAGGTQWSEAKGLGTGYPAYYISYSDAQEFITALNNAAGEQFRLPTESEWEFAARGGNKSKGYTFSGSNNCDDVAWHSGNAGGKVHDNHLNFNELGLWDMNGNVYEWCSDNYNENYIPTGHLTNPQGSTTGVEKIVRGGSYAGSISGVTHRYHKITTSRTTDTGFRLLLPAKMK